MVLNSTNLNRSGVGALLFLPPPFTFLPASGIVAAIVEFRTIRNSGSVASHQRFPAKTTVYKGTTNYHMEEQSEESLFPERVTSPAGSYTEGQRLAAPRHAQFPGNGSVVDRCSGGTSWSFIDRTVVKRLDRYSRLFCSRVPVLNSVGTARPFAYSQELKHQYQVALFK